ncbi:hypothetical protein A6770_34345 [Nostoc minutum NIES-26]|uniref:Uncharacterized protein n=1 Tax=Nostoc minutum NIES-26 TaxID=1844469 RepID=A0A367Q214_9NOSO|nr:hypothetical protein A6770_34345 [Nostoc minutum NIES-26]
MFSAVAWVKLFGQSFNINSSLAFLSGSGLVLLGLATSIATLLAEAFGLPVSYKLILVGFGILSVLAAGYLLWLQKLSSSFAQSINSETVLNTQEQESRQDNLNSSQSNLEVLVSKLSSWAGFIATIILIGAWLGQLFGYHSPALLNALALALVASYIGGQTYLHYIGISRTRRKNKTV